MYHFPLCYMFIVTVTCAYQGLRFRAKNQTLLLRMIRKALPSLTRQGSCNSALVFRIASSAIPISRAYFFAFGATVCDAPVACVALGLWLLFDGDTVVGSVYVYDCDTRLPFIVDHSVT